MPFVALACAATCGLLMAFALAPSNVPSQQVAVSEVRVADPAQLRLQLSDFLKYRTIGAASAPHHVPAEAVPDFQRAVQFLESTYGAAFRSSTVTKIAGYSLLLEFKGSDPSLEPFALLSHYDVVPATTTSYPLPNHPNADANAWRHHPFSGTVENGYIWGRGALDLKGNVIAILHAVNQLAATGTFRPKRGFFVAFGHDEEVGGQEGAAQIVRHLQQRDVRLDFVLDEGGLIIKDGLPPLTRTPLALVGTAEKDYSVLRMNVSSKGGHSSMPPVDASSVSAIMSQMLIKVDKYPSALRMQPPTTDFFSAVAEVAPVRGLRFLMQQAARWPVGPLFVRLMSLSSSTNALVATTTAVTTLQAGGTNNVLPQTGTVILNLRHLPGHTASEARSHLLRMVAHKDRDRVTVEILEDRKTGHLSPTDSPQFNLIKSAILETRWSSAQGGLDLHPLVAPYLVVGGTDAKHYAPLTRNIYRFQPLTLNRTGGDISAIHGTNERIHVDDLEASCRFFLHFVTIACNDKY